MKIIMLSGEKSTNSNSTSIYYKNFYNSDEPQIFLSDAGIHYTNPQLIDTWFSKYSNDSLFLFFMNLMKQKQIKSTIRFIILMVLLNQKH